MDVGKRTIFIEQKILKSCSGNFEASLNLAKSQNFKYFRNSSGLKWIYLPLRQCHTDSNLVRLIQLHIEFKIAQCLATKMQPI